MSFKKTKAKIEFIFEYENYISCINNCVLLTIGWPYSIETNKYVKQK